MLGLGKFKSKNASHSIRLSDNPSKPKHKACLNLIYKPGPRSRVADAHLQSTSDFIRGGRRAQAEVFQIVSLLDWLAHLMGGDIFSTEIKSFKETMTMLNAKYIFPIFLFLCASNSYAETTKEKVQRFYNSIVSVRSIVPPEARTADSLGVEREGNGVVIDGNHILTIGYIVLESESIEIGLSDGRRLPAKLVGYDHTSGFGLIKSVVPLKITPLQLGNSDNIKSEQDLLILPSPIRGPGSIVRAVSRRPFTGWWEYFIKSPIYTAPPNGFWAGAPILNVNGEILGIGSLFVSETVPGIYSPGNMSVPINLIKPILGDLISSGRRKSKIRPYLGISSDDSNDQIIVTRVSNGGPAFQAGIKPQDIIVTINGSQISNLKSFYEKVWNSGEAGVTVELSVLRNGSLMNFKVKTIDRLDYFFRPQPF